MNNNDDDFISIPIPRGFYHVVVKALADAQAAELLDQTATDGTGGSTPPNASATSAQVAMRAKLWPSPEVARLKVMLDNATMRALMDLTCRAPSTRVSFPELYGHVGRTKAQAQADLAHFTKLIRLHFNPGGIWPVLVHPAGGPDSSSSYEATPELAAAWNGQSAT